MSGTEELAVLDAMDKAVRRPGGSGAECGRYEDRPARWVIVLEQELTCAEAKELGRVLGKAGYQARFHSRTLAELAYAGTRAKGEEGAS